jgi:hypothetical protein
MQTLAYLGGAIVLGAVIFYGTMRFSSPSSRPAADSATKRIYDEEERARQKQDDNPKP